MTELEAARDARERRVVRPVVAGGNVFVAHQAKECGAQPLHRCTHQCHHPLPETGTISFSFALAEARIAFSWLE